MADVGSKSHRRSQRFASFDLAMGGLVTVLGSIRNVALAFTFSDVAVTTSPKIPEAGDEGPRTVACLCERRPRRPAPVADVSPNLSLKVATIDRTPNHSLRAGSRWRRSVRMEHLSNSRHQFMGTEGFVYERHTGVQHAVVHDRIVGVARHVDDATFGRLATTSCTISRPLRPASAMSVSTTSTTRCWSFRGYRDRLRRRRMDRGACGHRVGAIDADASTARRSRGRANQPSAVGSDPRRPSVANTGDCPQATCET